MNRDIGTLDVWNTIPGKYTNELKVLVTLAKAREYERMHVLNFGKSMV